MKLSEKVILKYLLSSTRPLLASEIADGLKCHSNLLSGYLTSLENTGLVITGKYQIAEGEKYSPKRGKNVYSASPIAREYIRKQTRDFIAFLCTVIAAIMATLTLIVTIILPLIS